MKSAVSAACLAALLLPFAAQAEPGLASEVYGPGVSKGETEIEGRYGILNGGDEDGEWAFVGEVSHGVTDWWRPAVLFEIEREPGRDAELEAVAFENVFDFTATRAWPVHFGAYVEYEAALHDGPDKIEAKLLSEHISGPLRLRLNLIAERQVGDGSGDDVEYGYAAQALWTVNDDFAVGLEGYGDAGADDSFGDFGDRAHYWGPVAQFEAFEMGDKELELQVGYLVGTGDAEADGQFQLKFEIEL
jgi:hypothetical protein